MNEPMEFASENEFRKALGIFANDREKVEAIMEAAKLKGEEIKAISIEVRSKKIPGFLLPIRLPGTFSQVIVSPESEPEFVSIGRATAKAGRMRTRACGPSGQISGRVTTAASLGVLTLGVLTS
jgi:hypothetical protein